MFGRIAVLGSCCVVIGAGSGAAWAGPLPDPVPVPTVVAVYSDAIPSFDPITHVLFVSGPITAVQLPGEVITANDPLVQAGAILTKSGLFTGSALNPLATFDQTGQLQNFTVQFSVGGTVIFSETFAQMSLGAIYATPNGTTVDFLGDVTSKSSNLNIVNSPVLRYFAETAGYGEKGSDTYGYDSAGNLVHNDSDINVPEPAGAALLLSGMLGLALSRARRR